MTHVIFDLLQILDEAGIDQPVAGTLISERLEISCTGIWKYVNLLRELGYVIDASDKIGYTLRKRTRLLLPYEVRRHLKTKVIGQEMHHYEQVPSTNALARQMMHEIGDEVQPGTVLVAEIQTGGLGRMNRVWMSPEGGIWATIVVMPKLQVDQTFVIMMAASISLTRAIRRGFGLSALIQWPNDVFIGDKKVAGTTLELSADEDIIKYCLIGIGVDVNVSIEKVMPNISHLVTSISDELGHDVDRAQFFAVFLKEFERRYQMILKGETESLFREWRSLSRTLHRRVRVRTIRESFEGEALEVDEHGALLIHKDNGEVERVIAGDCYLI
ncbi:MAG TPA: biotin--[acetyl-CoA-carboxylase] ligase [Methanocorpusculum sp.]|nr:biotin--[acetyl-CoA-carboxylase] ligase [Methanocorpusculum sp.]HJJ53441.1 biotin--[acetyl-CoA-carboxylase] ligase [Methanocorpusculum sp.]HKL98257.1 biotin--[acetyl-CoA-carboxylase] ligase [Methanocorpusculum sp.]